MKSVAQFIASRIVETGKAQNLIAEEAGFAKPNMISMIKQGHTKVPLEKVGKLALALETDPSHLLKMCFADYMPDTWKIIQPYMNDLMTQDELALLRALRRETGTASINALTENQKLKLKEFLDSIKITVSV